MTKFSLIKTTTTAAAAAIALFSQVAAAAAVAAPNVTAEPIGTSCTSYPGYDGSGAGPFIGAIDSTGLAIDGIGVDASYQADGGRQYGYVIAPTAASASTSRILMRCFNNTLQAQANTSTGGGGATWQNLVISGDPALGGTLGFGFPEDKYANIPVLPYWHFLDGEQVPGVYIGALGSTTFGFVDNSTDAGGDGDGDGEYYLLRLLGTDKFTGWERGERDTVGFLKLTYDY